MVLFNGLFCLLRVEFNTPKYLIFVVTTENVLKKMFLFSDTLEVRAQGQLGVTLLQEVILSL